MSIASAIIQKQQQVAAAYTACDAKGATMPAAGSQNLSNLATTIGTIQTGGGGGCELEPEDVTFIDYDGTVLHVYSFAEAAALQALPSNPSHTGLIAQGWNWTLAEVQAAGTAEESIIVGQLYTTSDGKTRIYLDIPSDMDEYNVTTGWSQNTSNGVTLDWGDGSDTITLSGTGGKNASHTYSAPGQYIMTFTVNAGQATLGNSNYGATSFLGNTEAYSQKMVIKAEIGDGITGFNNVSFFTRSDLRTISLPSSLISFGSAQPFYENTRLAAIVFPRVTSLSNSFFRYDSSLRIVSLPPTLTSLPNETFYQCYNLEHVKIGKIISIGNNGFYYVNSIGEIHSKSVTTLGSSVFEESRALKVLDLPNCTSFAANAFRNAYIKTLILSQSITTFQAQGFSGARGMREYVVPSGVTSIPNSLFDSCYNLRKVELPSGITSIGTNVWASNSLIEAVILKSATPPNLANTNALSGANMCPIYIPANSLSSYKTANNWSTFKNRFRPWDYGESEYGITPYTEVRNNLSGATQFNPRYCISSHIPLVDGHSYTFGAGAPFSDMHFCFYDSAGNYLGYVNASANPKTYTISFTGLSYGIMTCLQEWLSRCFVYDNTADELVWPVKKNV